MCRENNKDKISKAKKEYYEKNKISLNAHSKQYYEKNKDKIKSYNIQFLERKRKEKIEKQKTILSNKTEANNITSHVQRLEQNRQTESNNKKQINESDVFGFSYAEQNIDFI